MLIPEIIRKKRDGHALSTAEIQRFVQGVTEGEVTDAQIAAFAMASIFQDISYRERTAGAEAGAHHEHTVSGHAAPTSARPHYYAAHQGHQGHGHPSLLPRIGGNR